MTAEDAMRQISTRLCPDGELGDDYEGIVEEISRLVDAFEKAEMKLDAVYEITGKLMKRIDEP